MEKWICEKGICLLNRVYSSSWLKGVIDTMVVHVSFSKEGLKEGRRSSKIGTKRVGTGVGGGKGKENRAGDGG